MRNDVSNATQKRRARTRLTTTRQLVSAIVLALAPMVGHAQEDDLPIYESEPHDAITLVEQQGGGVFDVFPIEFPNGAVPTSPKPSDRLRVRLLSEPEREYFIAWKDIAKVEVFYDLILNEAEKLIAADQYDDAFRHLTYLHDEAPGFANVDRAMLTLLRAEAKTAISKGQMHAALSLLDELYQLDPSAPGVQRTIIALTNRLFDGYVRQRNYLAARRMLTWAADRFGRQKMATTVTAWQKRLDDRAEELLKQGRKAFADGRLRQAYNASRAIQQISPKLSGAQSFFDAVAKEYDSIVVGVSRMANPEDFSGNDWSSRRVRRLLGRLIAELSGIGPDGGQYACPFGKLSIGDDARSIRLEIRRDTRARSTQEGLAENATTLNGLGFGLARHLLQVSAAPSPAAPLWDRTFQSVAVQKVFDVHVGLRRSFLRPETLLQFRWGDDAIRLAPYVLVEQNSEHLSCQLNEQYRLRSLSQPQDVTEQHVRSSTSAAQAITRGDIDMVDRIFPADVEIFEAIDGVTVDKYAIPSVHMLIPNLTRPHVGNRTFRRAIAYGVNRKTLLEQDLLGNRSIDGCRLISGPFPAGRFDDDPLGYAYDASVLPRPYEPRLAVTYFEIGHQQVVAAATEAGTPPPGPPQLRLLHPDDEIPRLASAGIAQYLTAVGIECIPVSMPVGENWPTDNSWDLLYYDNVLAEPIVDAHRLLGANGVCGGGSSHLELALRQLANADNWSDARKRLHQIHWLARQEGAIIPLWQLTEHFAYGLRLTGVEPTPVTLYDVIESWTLDGN